MAEQPGTQGDGIARVKPGRVVLFGSGETSPSGRKVHARLFETLSPPINVAILETPAGFQPNSQVVAEEVADFIRRRLRNFHPQVTVVPARKKDTAFSPDNPDIAAPVLSANYIFLGPGSPTYTVRNLKGTPAWRNVLAAQRRGAVLALASAASIAAGAHTLPVYEIYKAGHDLHWAEGLDFFGDYGLELAIVPHWNNSDGGKKLDTRYCFMGRERMAQLEEMLPDTATVVGLDEHTAILFDFGASMCEVSGKSTITVRSRGKEQNFQAGATFPMDLLGDVRTPAFEGETWTTVAVESPPAPEPALPAEVRDLIAQRQVARDTRNWEEADRLRDCVVDLGFDIQDTPNGPRWRPRDTQAEWRALAYVREDVG
ncbi:MAG: cysteinyl-tRNA synthetase [Anaerolineae bacterium]